MPCLMNQFSVLESCTIGQTSDILSSSVPDLTEDQPAIPNPPLPEQNSPPQLYIHFLDICHCTRVPLKVSPVNTGHPLVVDSLLDSGATGMLIDVEFVRAEKLQTHHLLCAIPVYNIDGASNEAGSIKEEVDLICAYGDHTEQATFSVTSLGCLAIILGHTWLVKHNPEINWHTGEVKMTHCPELCGTNRRPSIEVIPDKDKSVQDSRS